MSKQQIKFVKLKPSPITTSTQLPTTTTISTTKSEVKIIVIQGSIQLQITLPTIPTKKLQKVEN